ncbi:hypothetical protein GCM10010244_73710 [Streptomyces coeruleorubidus]|nr:hypothetical protein GCM10010244_73710 [Streptomyces bellus]
MPFDAVLCDFDGVVHLWDPDGMNALDRSWGLAEGTLAGAAFDGELLQAAVTGRLSDEQWRHRVAEVLAPVCGSLARAQDLVGAWSGLTGRIGVAKPDPRVFATAAQRVRADVRRCLVVDDTLAHVDAARAAGLTGLHYQRFGQLRDMVAPLLG